MNFYDALTKKNIKLNINNNKITIYVCGPTVYDSCHIGHGRYLIVFDLLHRILSYNYSTTEILFYQNITDIDDKIVAKALQYNTTCKYITEKYIQEYINMRKLLNIKNITYMPKVTDHLNEIYEYIQNLIDKGNAYESEGSVYFDMSKYEDFDLVFNKQTNANSEVLTEKRYWKDFALWKKFDNYGYNSPWSYGRPGWHIECSAMIYKYCGETIDIHGGGADLAFPHHTNEILQCHARCGVNLSNIWLHNGMICIDSIKMSKSLLNSKYLHDIVTDAYTADLFRYWIMLYSYSADINFTEEVWTQTQTTFNMIRKYYFTHIYNKDFNLNKDLSLDFEFPNILQQLHINMNNNNNENVYTILNVCGFYMKPKVDIRIHDIEIKIHERIIAKINNNFVLSDKIRDELLYNCVQLRDINLYHTEWNYM